MREWRAVLVAAVAAVSLVGCRPEVASHAAPAASEPDGAGRTPVPQKRHAPPVETVRDWTNPPRPARITRDRNPFTFGTTNPPRGEAQTAPLPPGVSSDSLPELPLPVPAADLRLIGIASAERPDRGFTAIVTVGNDLLFARAGDTVAARYRVVSVGEDSLDVIDTVGNQPRRLSLR